MVYSPLTGSNQVKLLQTFQVEELIQAWQYTFQIDISLEFKSYKDIYLYECLETHLQFFYPFDIEGSARLYAELMKFNWYYMSDKWEYQIALADIQGKEAILEVGSGFGTFVRVAQQQGLNIQGIELNSQAITAAQSLGLPISSKTFTDLQRQGESFDCICSFQVLEHISDPSSFITNCLALLRPKGTLILGLPNAESFLKYQYNLLDLPPHHMLRWSLNSCKALGKLFNLSLEKYQYEPLASYHISGYLDSYIEHFRVSSPLGQIWLNARTRSLWMWLLQAGLRQYLRGQSFYTLYRKT